MTAPPLPSFPCENDRNTAFISFREIRCYHHLAHGSRLICANILRGMSVSLAFFPASAGASAPCV